MSLSVSTNTVTTILSTTAVGNGEITDLGTGGSCDHRGVVYDTSSHSDPGNVIYSSSGYASYSDSTGTFSTGTFTKSISSLSVYTTYYLRAYAHNSLGYVYGDEVSFTTLFHLASLRAKLAAGLDGISGLNVSPYIPDTITLPLGVVTLNSAKPVEYDLTAANLSWAYHFQIQILVNKGASVYTAQIDMDKYIDPTFTTAIKTAIEAVNLGTDGDAKRLIGAPSFGEVTYGSTKYLVTIFNLDIWASA